MWVIDFEASGLDKRSYPIEVGITNGKDCYSSLIKPFDTWQYWSNDAEVIHRIPRNQLLEQGEAYVFTPLHVAESVNGIDTKLSRKNEWGDLINLAFHEDKVKDWALFRCEYDVFMSLHCSQAVKEIIEEKKLTGIFFTNELGNMFSNQFDSDVKGSCL